MHLQNIVHGLPTLSSFSDSKLAKNEQAERLRPDQEHSMRFFDFQHVLEIHLQSRTSPLIKQKNKYQRRSDLIQ